MGKYSQEIDNLSVNICIRFTLNTNKCEGYNLCNNMSLFKDNMLYAIDNSDQYSYITIKHTFTLNMENIYNKT